MFTDAIAMYFHLTLKSRNVKTGNIPVSTSTAKTCPDACPLKKAGCYADAGPLGLFWRKVTEGKAGQLWNQFLESVAALPLGQLWRHNQSGDLVPSDIHPELICFDSLSELIAANEGKRGFTYTHFDPIEHLSNEIAIRIANENGFTINLSGNNFDHADALTAIDCGPVVTVAPLEYERRHKKQKGVVQWLESMAEYKERIAALGLKTKAGNKIVVCPATYSDDVSCKSCALCQKQRDSIVAFPAHGVSKKKADAIALAGAA